MKREIKFRAWDKDNKEMFEPVIPFGDSVYKTVVIDIEEDKSYLAKFENAEIMQSTGLKDKNGKEIYEGDILLGHSVYPECNIFESKLIGEVYYSSRGTWDCYSYILGGFNEQVEVIGNIYENADLLEVAEDGI